jgi:hypothetical protein
MTKLWYAQTPYIVAIEKKMRTKGINLEKVLAINIDEGKSELKSKPELPQFGQRTSAI